MTYRLKLLAGALAVAAGAALPTLATAQPLPVVVRPVAAIVSAPFTIFSPPPANTYNPFPAAENAVAFAPDGRAIVATPVLRQTGPRYDNPANANFRRPIVIRRGSTVPGFINTAPARNVSVRGLVPNAEYAFFISPEQRVVFLDPATRRVVRVMR